MSETKSPVASIAQSENSWRKNTRLLSGLVLFSFVAGHLINHALGLISVDVMESMQKIRSLIWRNPVGTVILFGSLAVHVVLTLEKFVRRRSWRMSPVEGVQLLFGMGIPIFLIPHILATRGAWERFGVDDTYSNILASMWPTYALTQATLIVLVWVHGCIGLYFWFRLKPWFRRIAWFLYTLAVVIPILAYAGFTTAGREIARLGHSSAFTQEQFDALSRSWDVALVITLGVLATVVGFRLFRTVSDRLGPSFTVTYANGQVVTAQVGQTILDISRANAIPHASVCGGRARCSTCRVRVLEGLDKLPEKNESEERVLTRVGAGANVRLACQLAPRHDIQVATLLPANDVSPSVFTDQDKYLWGVDQSVTLLFADIRGFTSLSEAKLPYDVVFILNQYLGQMSDAITDAGGYVDKFIGDGIMAIFGMEKPVEQGAQEALAAARAMSGVLTALNKTLAADLSQPLNIGIGLHSGPAILGRIGVTGDSGATQRITALGDTVNTASRLESACKELSSQLVVSDVTIATSKLDVAGGRHELIAVKGREEKVSIRAFSSAMEMQLANR